MNDRIWIYTLSRELSAAEITDFKTRCQQFVSGWTAHDISLDASFDLYQNRLLIFKVNEEKYNASGCSIDKQLRFVKELEQAFSVELLNRMLVAIDDNGTVSVLKQSELKELLASGKINEHTHVYDNTITDAAALNNGWKKALKDTWLSKYLVTQ